VPRALCPFCSSRDPQTLSYIYSEDERDYRLDICSGCRKYVKTVDTRNLARGCYPPLEQIASLHLDIKAAEAGFEADARSACRCSDQQPCYVNPSRFPIVSRSVHFFSA
jgi:FdhE protein